MSMKFLKTAASYWKKVSGNVVTKDSSALVGIGTDSPGDYHAGADDLVIGNADHDAGITITSTTTGLGRLFFADGTSGSEQYGGWISYNHNANSLQFAAGNDGSASLTITGSSDDLTTTGNFVAGTAGKGIDFSAQTATTTGTTTAELLNHYEEGTWVPTFTGVTSITYTTQTGFYTRVGDMVYVQFFFAGNWTASSTLVLNGLPFTVGGASGAVINIGYQNFEAVAPVGYCGLGGTTATFYELGTTGTGWAPPTDTGKYLIGQGVYKTT